MSSIALEGLDDIPTALGQQLSARGAATHLAVVNGSALLAMGLGDRPTRDVDVVALVSGAELVTADPLPMAVLEAAARVARDFRLESNWLNPGPTSLLRHGLPLGFEGRAETRTFGPALTVSFASRLDQVHLKLYALADRREPRDEADLRRLAPTGEELRSAAAWARTHNAPGPFDDQMSATLAAFGIDDVGRVD